MLQCTGHQEEARQGGADADGRVNNVNWLILQHEIQVDFVPARAQSRIYTS